jgi:hypothetical protein
VSGCEEAPTADLNGFAAVANWPRASREMPVSATNRPIKTRRLKNADCEVDFFFISGDEVEFEFEYETPFVAEILETRQHFFYFFTKFSIFRVRFPSQSCQFVPEARKTNPWIGTAQKRRLIVKRRSRSENEIRITGLSVAGRGRPGSINILSERNVGDGLPSGRFDCSRAQNVRTKQRLGKRVERVIFNALAKAVRLCRLIFALSAHSLAIVLYQAQLQLITNYFSPAAASDTDALQ